MAYTVQPGDSLWAIAQKLLGDGSRWREIQQMNQTGSMIYPGQTLQVPGQTAAGPAGPGPAGVLPVLEDASAQTPDPAGVDLLQDPGYAEYLRGMGFKESQIESQLASQLDALDRRQRQEQPYFDYQGEQAVRNAGLSWENRGLFGSGARLRDQAQRQMEIDRNRRLFEQGIMDQRSSAQSQAASQIGDLRRQRAEQEIDTRGRLTQRDIGATYG